jgi:hypothetical protein
MAVNHKRVARLMREDNLLAISAKAFVATTQSDQQTANGQNQNCLNQGVHPTLCQDPHPKILRNSLIPLTKKSLEIGVVKDSSCYTKNRGKTKRTSSDTSR